MHRFLVIWSTHISTSTDWLFTSFIKNTFLDQEDTHEI